MHLNLKIPEIPEMIGFEKCLIFVMNASFF